MTGTISFREVKYPNETIEADRDLLPRKAEGLVAAMGVRDNMQEVHCLRDRCPAIRVVGPQPQQ